MSGRKTQVQLIMDIVDKRIRSMLGTSGKLVQGLSPNSARDKTGSSQAFENVSFITRDEHRGKGHGDLPNSRPSFDLDCELVPDKDGIRRIGLSDRAWGDIYTHKVNLKGDNCWLKMDVDYFRRNIAFKTFSNKVVLCGYGNHRVVDSNGRLKNSNIVTLSIARPFPYSKDKAYTGIKSWRVDTWYSRVDIDNETGIGSRRSCAGEGSSRNPQVEAEIVDTGNSERIYIRFRNFLPYPVVVGVAVSY
jgi:hypothetical protein